jgi:hypothetical protein
MWLWGHDYRQAYAGWQILDILFSWRTLPWICHTYQAAFNQV